MVCVKARASAATWNRAQITFQTKPGADAHIRGKSFRYDVILA